MTSTTKSTIAALISVSLWASAFPVVRYMLNFYTPEALMLFRFLVAAITMTAIVLIMKIKPPARKDLPLFALAGLLGIFLYAWLFIAGVNTVSAGVSAFLISSAPVFAALFSILFLRERVGALAWTGIAVSLAGLAAVTASQMYGFSFNLGVGLLVGAAIATSLYTIIQRKLTRTYTALETTAYTIILGTIPMLIFLPRLIAEFQTVPLTTNLIPLYLGIFPAATAYLAWNYAVSHARNTTQVTRHVYLIPFLATVIAFIWLGEAITLVALAGGIVIITGMIITGLQKTTNGSTAATKEKP